MTAHITAAVRTPWAPRQGALEAIQPQQLLGVALNGLLEARGLDSEDVGLLLVACDTGVGAQALNLARRTAVALGWHGVPALTVDGQGVGDLGLIDVVAGSASDKGGQAIRGPVIVAAVDSTSTVPPGAGLVRDYGRPALEAPRQRTLDNWARAAGLTRDELDCETVRLLSWSAPSRHHAGVVAVPRARGALVADVGVHWDADWALLAPLNDDDGLLTAFHEAPLADGACAVLIEHNGDEPAARPLQSFLTAHGDDLVDAIAAIPASAILADANVVPHCLTGGGDHPLIAPVRALGSTPSANGLRCLVDAVHSVGHAVSIVAVGAHGQLSRVEVQAGKGLR